MKEIKVTTIYTEEKVKKFLKFYYFDKIKIARIILNILMLIIVINFFTEKDRTITDIIAFIIALIGLLELNTSFLPWFNYYKLKKKKNNIINDKVTYVFKKNNFKLTNVKDEYIDYNTLFKVVDTSNDYYIYVNKCKSFIVSKENLSHDEKDYLTKLFKEKVSTYIEKKNV